MLMGSKIQNGNLTITDTDTSITEEGHTTPLRAMWGMDFNKDGVLDEQEVLGHSGYEIKYVAPSQYAWDLTTLKQIIWGWKYVLNNPDAAALMSYFVYNELPNDAHVVDDSFSSIDPGLTHAVGGIFDQNCIAPTKRLVFDKSSAFSTRVAAAVPEFQKLATAAFSAGSAQVINYFQDNPTVQQHEFEFAVNTSWNFSSTDNLAKSIGGFSTKDMVFRATVRRDPDNQHQYLTNVSHFDGSIVDLYDFDYDATGDGGDFVKAAAVVQAGYGTLGNAGHVFRVEVQVENDVTQSFAWSDVA